LKDHPTQFNVNKTDTPRGPPLLVLFLDTEMEVPKPDVAVEDLKNQQQCLGHLLEHKADVNLTDSRGFTALHYLCNLLVANPEPESIRAEMASKLLEAGANINAPNEYRQTALHFSALRARKLMVDLLVDHKAEVDARDSDGETPIMFAVKHPDRQQHSPPVHHELAANYSAVWSVNSLHVMKSLLAHKADIDGRKSQHHDDYGNDAKKTPLVIAVEYENVSAVKLLLDRKADVSLRDVENQSAVQHCTNAQILHLLNQKQAQIDGSDDCSCGFTKTLC